MWWYIERRLECIMQRYISYIIETCVIETRAAQQNNKYAI